MKWLVASIAVACYLLDLALIVLNRGYSQRPLPAEVRDVYDEGLYRRWQSYFFETQRFALVRSTVNLLVLLAFLLVLAEPLSHWTGRLNVHPIWQSLLFLGIYYTLTTALAIPLDAYRIFSIEERHGFNRRTVKMYVRDLLVSYAASLGLGAVLVGGAHGLYLRFGGRLWTFLLVLGAASLAVLLLARAFWGRISIRLFYKPRPLPPGTLRSRIEELAAAHGFNARSIAVIDTSTRSSKLNALFTGLGRTREVMFFDTLLDKLSEDEIVTVIAHELGHAVHGDMLGRAVRLGVGSALYALGMGVVLSSPGLFKGFGWPEVHFGLAVVLFQILFVPVGLVWGIVGNYFSRREEYRADRFAAENTDPQWTISGLKSMHRENLINLNPHPLSVLLYASHPTLGQRIRALGQVGVKGSTAG